jgi:hypothetical protein
VRGRERADVAAADDQRDDRAGTGQPGDRIGQPPAVGDRFDVQGDGGGLLVVRQMVEHILGGEVGAVAQPDREADTVARLGEGEGQSVVDPAAGRHDGDPAGRYVGRTGHEARDQSAARREEPGGVRPEQPDPGTDRHRGQIVLIALAFRAGFGEPAAVDDHGAGTGRRGLGHDVRACLCGDADQCQVDRAVHGGRADRRVEPG